MSRLISRPVAAVAAATLLALGTAGCGSNGEKSSDRKPAESATSSSTAAQAAAGNCDWLLRFTTAQGAAGEQSRAVLVRFNPTTGAAVARSLPTMSATDASQDQEALLVSADHTRAIPDTSVPAAEAATGKLVVYSVADDTSETVDIRALTGKPDLKAVGWAFDPESADVLRVVDSGLGVWKLDLAAKSATQEGTLPKKDGWIFGNGFAKNTGEPYVESIDSDQTDPAGLGDSDTSPVQRQGGTLIRYDGQPLEGLPQPPCGFAGGFQYADGSAWLFCADTPSITAYQAAKGGASWHQFGTPSANVLPKTVAAMSFALPPVG
jgi:hypothetical protein